MSGRFQFNAEKAVEVILYVTKHLDNITFHNLSKILYFADLNHLEDFGRQITSDNYVAMKHGPVPSGMYDILKSIRNGGEVSFATHARNAFTVEDGYKVIPLRDPDMGLLSGSDMQCLDKSIGKYGSMSFNELTEISHEGAWDKAGFNENIAIEDMIGMLPNHEDVLEHFFDPAP